LKYSRLIQKFRYLYRRSLVADGCFKLENVKAKCPEDDVFLSDGRGFVVGDKRYQEHISTAIELRQVEFFELRDLNVHSNKLHE
jgi:hypothetical protein